MTDEEILALFKAHRAAMSSIVMMLCARSPGAIHDIIASLRQFEKAMRATNEADATIAEVRRIRKGLMFEPPHPGPAKPLRPKPARTPKGRD